MKIYTKTGDSGTTSLIGGTRVKKDHLRIECYGTLDELNSFLGLLRDQKVDSITLAAILQIQSKLFTIGAFLATDPAKSSLKNGKNRTGINPITDEDLLFLENQIDSMSLELPVMTHFILPGGHQTVSFCHLARCVCRRAERLIVALNEIEAVDAINIKYLNRLSDYLFVLARKLTQDLGVNEVKWEPEKV